MKSSEFDPLKSCKEDVGQFEVPADPAASNTGDFGKCDEPPSGGFKVSSEGHIVTQWRYGCSSNRMAEFTVGGRSAGMTMPDRTVYVGLSPDTGRPFYTKRLDASGAMNWRCAAEFAKACRANGHCDWRMPTIGELEVMFNNQSAIGGFGNDWYLSSSKTHIRRREKKGGLCILNDGVVVHAFEQFGPEKIIDAVRVQRFQDGIVSSSDDTGLYKLRCVRG